MGDQNTVTAETAKSPPTFKLKSTQDFEDRQSAIFGCLEEVTLRSEEAPGAMSTSCDYIIDEDLIGQGKPSTSRKRLGNTPLEFMFKRPRIPASRGRRNQMPDYVRNPEKWKKYSVADTDISERTNTAAAFSFLKEMEERKRSAEEPKESVCSKIVFKKPRRIQEVDIAASASHSAAPLESTRRHVMAAFEFGKKKANEKKVERSEHKSKASEMTLSHLTSEEEES